MPKKSKPKASALQFWPRKRAAKVLPSVNWKAIEKDSGLKGFIGYKVGMVSVHVKDDTPDSMTKGKRIIVPASVVECPTVKIYSVRFYKNKKVLKDLVVSNDKELKKILKNSKKSSSVEDLDKVADYDDVSVVVYTEVKKTGIKKKPDMCEIGLGGAKEVKLSWIKERLNKPISIAEVFGENDKLVDIRGVTKGYGTQGPVKRHGISLKVAKAEKGQRRPGSLAPWHPARVTFVTPMAGQTGYFSRVVYNNLILKKGTSEDNIKDFFDHYGKIKTDYLILKGSIQGPRKRQLILTAPLRATKKQSKKKLEVLEIR